MKLLDRVISPYLAPSFYSLRIWIKKMMTKIFALLQMIFLCYDTKDFFSYSLNVKLYVLVYV